MPASEKDQENVSSKNGRKPPSHSVTWAEIRAMKSLYPNMTSTAIAERLGVALSKVSRALNNPDKESWKGGVIEGVKRPPQFFVALSHLRTADRIPWKMVGEFIVQSPYENMTLDKFIKQNPEGPLSWREIAAMLDLKESNLYRVYRRYVVENKELLEVYGVSFDPEVIEQWHAVETERQMREREHQQKRRSKINGNPSK